MTSKVADSSAVATGEKKKICCKDKTVEMQNLPFRFQAISAVYLLKTVLHVSAEGSAGVGLKTAD